MEKLILEHMSSSSYDGDDVLWVKMHCGSAHNHCCCYTRRSKTTGWEWNSGSPEPYMPTDLRELFHGNPGEYALDALFTKTNQFYELVIPKRHNMQMKTKTTAKPGDKFLVAAEYDAEELIRIGHVSITGFSQLTCYEYPETRNEPYRPFVPGDIVYVDSWEGHPAYDVTDADEPLYCWQKVIMLEQREAQDGTVGVPDENYPDKTRWIHCSHLKLLARAEDNSAWIVDTGTSLELYSCEDGVKTKRAVIACDNAADRKAIEQYVINYCNVLRDEIRTAAVNRYKAKYETE